jgi:hypothetical protein
MLVQYFVDEVLDFMAPRDGQELPGTIIAVMDTLVPPAWKILRARHSMGASTPASQPQASPPQFDLRQSHPQSLDDLATEALASSHPIIARSAGPTNNTGGGSGRPTPVSQSHHAPITALGGSILPFSRHDDSSNDTVMTDDAAQNCGCTQGQGLSEQQKAERAAAGIDSEGPDGNGSCAGHFETISQDFFQSMNAHGVGQHV